MKFTRSEIEEGLKNSSPEVLSYFYKNFWRYCIAFVQKKGGRPEDGEDVFQNSLLSLITQVQKGAYRSGNLSAYFKSIIRHTWLNELKLRKKLPQTELDEAAQEQLDQALGRYQVIELVHQYVHRLSETCQELIKAAYWSEMSQQEIANELKLTYGSTRARLTQCREALFHLLRKDPTFLHASRK